MIKRLSSGSQEEGGKWTWSRLSLEDASSLLPDYPIAHPFWAALQELHATLHFKKLWKWDFKCRLKQSTYKK